MRPSDRIKTDKDLRDAWEGGSPLGSELFSTLDTLAEVKAPLSLSRKLRAIPKERSPWSKVSCLILSRSAVLAPAITILLLLIVLPQGPFRSQNTVNQEVLIVHEDSEVESILLENASETISDNVFDPELTEMEDIL